MNKEQREKRVLEVFDAMGIGKVTQDDFWDALLPTVEC